MKKLNNIWLTILIILSFIGFVLGMVWFFIWKKEEIPAQIIGSLFGVLVSAIVTMLLLSAQTNSEEEHEVSGKIFDKKTEAYLNVLNSLEKIISDGNIDTIRENKLNGKEDELSKLLFSLTRLSSFVEVKKEAKNNSNTDGMNDLIGVVTNIIKTTTEEGSRIPDSSETDFWNGKGKKTPESTLKDYYIQLSDGLSKISNFATTNIQRGSAKRELDLKKLVTGSGLFSNLIVNSGEKTIPSTEDETSAEKKPMDYYRIDCIADCLKEMEKQLKNKFGDASVVRDGNGGDDYYWGRWSNEETSPETIADWLLDRSRRGFIGYKVKVNNNFDAHLYLCGDAKSFNAYICPASNEAKKLINLKYDDVKKKFGLDGGIGWWIPNKDKLDETGWILGGTYGGLSFAFDFRNASMEKAEYKEKYQKFKATAIQEMISGRDDSIIKTVNELKKLIEQ